MIKRIPAVLFLLISTLPALHAQKTQITLEDIWLIGTYGAKSVSGLRSMSDGENYTVINRSEKGAFIEKFSYKSGKSKGFVLGPDELASGKKAIELDGYQFSADESKVLITTDQESIYRYSTKGLYYVYDFAAKKLRQINTSGKASHATFSPDGNYVSFVSGNNLYFEDVNSGKRTTITKTGVPNKLINGMSDWVYEEEFAFTKAYEWSPDGKYIAYYEFDESNVKEFDMPMYGGGLYPEHYKFKYPKAGERNSIVRILIYAVETGKTMVANVGKETDQYIPRINWTKRPGKLLIQRMNRNQNQLDLLVIDADSGKPDLMHSEKSNTYIDVFDDLTFLSNGDEFLWTSETEGYKHIYLFNLNGKMTGKVTKGEWEVTNVYGVNEKKGLIYYQSTEEGPLTRNIYSIGLDGKGKTKLSEATGQNRAQFSKGFKYYINTHTDANTPPTITLHNSKGKQVRVLESNEKLKSALKTVNAPKKEFFKFNTGKVELNGWMIKPNDFSEKKKYPVFMYVYGGPGSNTVGDSWGGANQLWYMHLAELGYIVVSVDNRGTGSRGREFKHCTYQELGKLETEDQIASAEYLMSLPYVDASRIGIQGWSYGGYMTSLCLTKGAKYFKAGIAVAPVTNWRFYDTIYTERFMRTPKENASGYDDNSPINHVEKMTGKYLLVHGSADDNVHYQNTMEMISALVDANKQFDLFIYPDKNHGIYGGNTRYHLYTKMTEFLKENL